MAIKTRALLDKFVNDFREMIVTLHLSKYTIQVKGYFVDINRKLNLLYATIRLQGNAAVCSKTNKK